MEGVPIRRYLLVPEGEAGSTERGMSPVRRRFQLARVAVSPRSAAGVDRHERMERVAERERTGRP